MNKFFSFIFFIALVWAAPYFAGAQTVPQGTTTLPANFNVLFAGKKIPADNIKQWGHPSQMRGVSPMLDFLPPVEDLIKRSLGKTAAEVVDHKLEVPFSLEAIYDFTAKTAKLMDTDAVEPKLTIENNRATEFIPPQDGVKTDLLQTTKNILVALQSGKTETETSSTITTPANKLSQTNNLGIVELVGHGVSSFKGSPSNRRHNINIGVEKIKGVLIPVGGTFSFNDNLGPVEAEQGFLPELVIKRTGTVLELGGGLCQVSSTTFRAAMDAGLPIKERRNHAYAVQYYAPQGTDATIYPGIVDLKFTNDTPAVILVWPHFTDANTLVFDFYGTKDNRQVTLGTPTTYDRKTDGSMKATWTRTVEKDGKKHEDIFKSVYQSPALFHKEEAFPTTTPATELTPSAVN